MNKAKMLLEYVLSMNTSIYASREDSGVGFFYLYVEGMSTDVKLEAQSNGVKFTISHGNKSQAYCFSDYKEIEDSLNFIVQNYYESKNSYMLTKKQLQGLDCSTNIIKKYLRGEHLEEQFKVKTINVQNFDVVEITDLSTKMTHAINLGKSKNDYENEVKSILDLIKVQVILNDNIGIQNRQYLELFIPAYDIHKYPLLLTGEKNKIKDPLIHTDSEAWLNSVYQDALEKKSGLENGLEKIIQYVILNENFNSDKNDKNIRTKHKL